MTISIIPAAIIASVVSPEMFSANSLFHVDDLNPQFVQNIENFGVKRVRWPGGSISEMLFDPASPDSFLAVPRTTGMNYTDRILSFTEITQWGKDTNHEIMIVLPTIHVLTKDASGKYVYNQAALDAIRGFVKKALAPQGEYADAKIAGFEIGNEYWAHMTAREYGMVANAMIKVINAGIVESGAGYRPDILVQVGDGWGPEYDPGGQYSALGWSWTTKLKNANVYLIEQIDKNSLSMINGLIDHYYTTNRGNGVISPTDHKHFFTKYNVWKNKGYALDVHITEWNMKNAGLNGLPVFAMGAGLLETFEQLHRQGADSAYVWPINQNTANDLAGNVNAGPGHLSATGAVFKLLSENVKGLSSVDTTGEGDHSIERSLYKDDKTSVLFLSPVNAALKDTLDLSSIAPPNPNDGSTLMIERKSVIRSEPEDKYVGKGAGAQILTDAPVVATDLTALPISLAQYEVTMIRLYWKAPEPVSVLNGTYEGKEFGEVINGNWRDQRISGKGGDDYINALGGNDVLIGGAGDDVLLGGTGNDVLYGDETDYTGNGKNVLVDGNGDDTLYGGQGPDKFYFGNKSFLTGGYGADAAYGKGGADVFNFGGTAGWTGLLDFELGVDKINFLHPIPGDLAGLKLFDKSENGKNYVRIEYKDVYGSGVIRVEAPASVFVKDVVKDIIFKK